MAKRIPMQKSFDQWKIDELVDTFHIERIFEDFPFLKEWEKAEENFTEVETERLKELKTELARKVDVWNEDELKFFFISQLIAVAKLETKGYRIFTQRYISAIINEIKLYGFVDFVIAKGIEEPKQPFFFLHEYKQEKRRANDPLAQLLSEMLVAQFLNEINRPLFGCYVLGRMWFFVVLLNDKFSVSLAYDATQDDIFKIVAMLRWVKTQIEKENK